MLPTSVYRISKDRGFFKLQSGTVPPSIAKLMLTFLDSNCGTKFDTVHDVNISFADLYLSVVKVGTDFVTASTRVKLSNRAAERQWSVNVNRVDVITYEHYLIYSCNQRQFEKQIWRVCHWFNFEIDNSLFRGSYGINFHWRDWFVHDWNYLQVFSWLIKSIRLFSSTLLDQYHSFFRENCLP